jgi:hypothetical protein
VSPEHSRRRRSRLDSTPDAASKRRDPWLTV